VVLLEAMAAGTAVVASDLPGYRNAARPGRDALLSPPGDSEALAATLSRALHEPGLAAELIGAGEARAQAFSMDHLAERYLELFERCIAARGGTDSRRPRVGPGRPTGRPRSRPNGPGSARRQSRWDRYRPGIRSSGPTVARRVATDP